MTPELRFRRAVPSDAPGIVTVLAVVVDERVRSLGFTECGRLSRQVKIDGIVDDEILMEWFP